MPEAIEVQFKGRRLDYFVNPDRIPVAAGDQVIVQVERGLDMGLVAHLAVEVKPPERGGRFRSIVRRALEDDHRQQKRIRAEEEDAVRTCRERVRRLRLDMKVVDAETQIDGNRITFYFTAEQRVDFRELVRDLASIFKTRIELRQIGARDAAKRIGGIGPCGREYCCSTWLKEFKPVTLKMAKNQGLALAPSKISGGCGRLMCCLMYEDPFYKEMVRVFPKVGTELENEGRKLRVSGNDFFREVIKLHDQDGNPYEWSIDEFPLSPSGWRGAVRARGADRRGGEGSGCGKSDPRPTGMTHARGRDDDRVDDRDREPGPEDRGQRRGPIPIEPAPSARGAPFMHGGRGSRAGTGQPDGKSERAEPADLVRNRARGRRRADGEEIGSGKTKEETAASYADAELVAAAEPEDETAAGSGERPRGRRGRRRSRRGGSPVEARGGAPGRDREPPEPTSEGGKPSSDRSARPGTGESGGDAARDERPGGRRRRRRRRRRGGGSGGSRSGPTSN